MASLRPSRTSGLEPSISNDRDRCSNFPVLFPWSDPTTTVASGRGATGFWIEFEIWGGDESADASFLRLLGTKVTVEEEDIGEVPELLGGGGNTEISGPVAGRMIELYRLGKFHSAPVLH